MPAEGDWRRLTDEIAARLAPHGIDLVHPFAVGWFNSAVEPAETSGALPRSESDWVRSIPPTTPRDSTARARAS